MESRRGDMYNSNLLSIRREKGQISNARKVRMHIFKSGEKGFVLLKNNIGVLTGAKSLRAKQIRRLMNKKRAFRMA